MVNFMDKKNKQLKNPVFNIGDVVRHKHYPFRGVVFDVDPEFDNTEEWYNSIPAEIRPSREQPFYHLLAENEDSFYTAYVSQQNLVPSLIIFIEHPDISDLFDDFDGMSLTAV